MNHLQRTLARPSFSADPRKVKEQTGSADTVHNWRFYSSIQAYPMNVALNTSEKSEPTRQILTTHLPHSHGPYSLIEQIQKEHMFPHGLTIRCGLGANLETQEDLDNTLLLTMRESEPWHVVSPLFPPHFTVTYANPHTSTLSPLLFAGLAPYPIEQAEKATQRRHITLGLVEQCECPQCHEILDGTLTSGSLRPKNDDSTLQTLPSTIKVCPHQNCLACICEFCEKVVGSHYSIAQDHLCQEMIELAKTEVQKEVTKIKITSESRWACPKCSKPRFAEGQTEFSHNDRWNRRICECGCVWCGVCSLR
ncbi:hypothetical protein BLNAU_10404 [Blattamonas nauphoetae]|uniref:RING-type domain-containing protein n=1 Tax=Blattamonas nauphoetae TaxID=2049346 RepID=A0ABQ9XQ61_9EUKA|nr:hypothetical protein BLNAU_10404 [Blattamonas nauphoetae]